MQGKPLISNTQITNKDMKAITRSQLYYILKYNKYIILRFTDNSIGAVNCSIVNLSRFKKVPKDNEPTKYISYYPCSFMEYITRKTPFMH